MRSVYSVELTVLTHVVVDLVHCFGILSVIAGGWLGRVFSYVSTVVVVGRKKSRLLVLKRIIRLPWSVCDPNYNGVLFSGGKYGCLGPWTLCHSVWGWTTNRISFIYNVIELRKEIPTSINRRLAHQQASDGPLARHRNCRVLSCKTILHSSFIRSLFIALGTTWFALLRALGIDNLRFQQIRITTESSGALSFVGGPHCRRQSPPCIYIYFHAVQQPRIIYIRYTF